MVNKINQLLHFFHLCERLKTEKRHGKTSDDEHDRVASHSWRMALIIMFIEPYLEHKIDLLKAMKMAIIHDLPEIITGDQAYFHHAFNEQAKMKKKLKETEAMTQLAANLPSETEKDLLQLWTDYENQASYESKLVKAVDKIEAQIQHNEADIAVWNDYDKRNYQTYLNPFCEVDKFLLLLKETVQAESTHKLAGVLT